MLVGIALVSLYFGYSQLTSPWLTVDKSHRRMERTAAAPENSPALSERTERAENWFKGDPWVKDANARFGDGSRFMYFQNYELFNDDHSIKVDPIAILWQSEKSEVPYTLTARSAQLDATSRFKLDTNEFGAISSGQLQGDVRITGPDGFRLEGRTFSVSDNALKVTTSQPVRFWWGPHSGTAQSGAEIDLLSSGDLEKKGLLSITDVQRIRLLGRIDCQLFFPNEDTPAEAISLKINAANGFEFFVPTHQATFFGFSDQKIRNDNQILIERPTVSGGLDRLFCSMLTLQFQPAMIDSALEKKRSTKLVLASIQAEGSKVVFNSQEHNVTAVMSRLKYHVEERVLELLSGVTPATGRPNSVRVHQNGRMLTAVYVVMTHDAHGQPQSIECRGPGQIEPSDQASTSTLPVNEQAFNATWTESLAVRLSSEQKITLKGNALVSQMSEDKEKPIMSLSGDVIEMTGLRTTTSEPESDPSSGPSGIDLSHMSPKELIATGNVTVTHQDVAGHIREKLKLNFREVPRGSGEPEKIRTISQSSPASDTTEEQGTTEFSCDSASADISFTRLAEGQLSSTWNDVWLIGKVKIDHTGIKKDSDFSAEGNALSAKSGFSEVGNVSLYGDPAKARLASQRIEGPQINLEEHVQGGTGIQRPLTVPGSGSILFVIDQGFDGNTLQKPSLLEIYWTESMAFSDSTASFIGNIRAVMTNELDHKVELTCASMKVYLTEGLQLRSSGQQPNRLQASGSATDADKNPIERIECNSKVVVDIDQMKEGVVKSRSHAEFSDLKVNMITGEFEAVGSGSSGIIESTHPNSSDTPRTAPRANARANTPVSTPSDAFVFVQARFIGSIEGNYKQRFVQLKQHVRGVFGPVRQMGDRIVLDGLNVNELPPNTGSLRCENLSFSQIDSGESGVESQFEMVAESNMSDGSGGTRAPCHLESIEISGDADWIKYDSSKQQFILRAGQGRQTTVSYREKPDAAPRTFTGQRFDYYRERNQLIADKITGVQGTGNPGR